MTTPETLTTAEERLMLERVKRAVDYVDNKGMSPNEAVTKLARDEKLMPGVVGTICRAYNTGRQLGQWRANDSMLDKLASFPLADADAVLSTVYPRSVDTPSEAVAKTAFDDAYRHPPTWLTDERARDAARRDLAPLIKQADFGACPKCGSYPCACDGPRGDLCGEADSSPKQGTDEWRMRRAYGEWERAKNAGEAARRHANDVGDRLRAEVTGVVDYFKQASYLRMPFAQVEHAARVYLGPAAVELMKLAYERARLREPRAGDTKIQKLAFDLDDAPFTLLARCVKTGEELLVARQWAKEASDLVAEVEEVTLRPFACPAVGTTTPPSSRLTSPSIEGGSEKRGYFGMAIGSALGNAAATTMGSYPKTKDSLIEDEWLKLEDPAHQNELRKIKTHAMLNSLLTDPDDPISGYDPDKVIAAYNEISQTAPRVADSPATLKPLLRKRLAGAVEPFEAKELVDMEKGLRDSKSVPPSSMSLADAPASLLG